jgi:hypothetical protein
VTATLFAPARPLDERLVRAAVAWSLHPVTAFEEAADEVVTLAHGNRSAVERAIWRVHRSAPAAGRGRPAPVHTTRGRATAVLRLALARGDWAW